MNQKIIKIYTFLQSKINPSFRFPGGNSKLWVNRCIDDLTKREGSLTLSVVVDYCVQQVFVYKDRSGGRFNVSWAFSENAVKKFYEAKRGIRFYQDTWLKGLGLSRDILLEKFTDINEHLYKKEIYLEYEDTLKQTFPDPKTQYIYCITQTTLYAPQSSVCKKCVFKKKCAEVLKKRNPELFRLRRIKLCK